MAQAASLASATVATLGRVDEDGGTIDTVLSTLLRAKGRSGGSG